MSDDLTKPMTKTVVFAVKLRTNVELEEPNAALFEKIVFEEYQEDQACSGGLEWRKPLNYNTTNLTFEFRLKKNKICLGENIF